MSAQRLSEKMAKEHGLTDAFAKKLVLSVLGEIESIAVETGRCQIRGFGTFKLKTFKQRRMHDYSSRTIVILPERTKLVFEHGRDRIGLISGEEVIPIRNPDALLIHKNVDKSPEST